MLQIQCLGGQWQVGHWVVMRSFCKRTCSDRNQPYSWSSSVSLLCLSRVSKSEMVWYWGTGWKSKIQKGRPNPASENRRQRIGEAHPQVLYYAAYHLFSFSLRYLRSFRMPWSSRNFLSFISWTRKKKMLLTWSLRFNIYTYTARQRKRWDSAMWLALYGVMGIYWWIRRI